MFRVGAVTKDENNRFKNKVKNHINKAKSNYFKNLLNRNCNNIRETWKTLNSLLNRSQSSNSLRVLLVNGVEYCEDGDIAEIFSDFFANIPLQLAAEVPHSDTDPISYLAPRLNETLELTPCTPEEVSNIIFLLKITKQGKNCIPIRILKANRGIISPVICNLINTCMREGSFPDSLKIAKVLPIFKKGNPREPSNYRPISLLPYLSKIFEKVLYYRLITHFCTHSILSQFQFGFRKNLSTFDAIVAFTEKLYEGLNEKKSILNIFIDYSKAFDSVDLEILLKKLDNYGVRGDFLALMRSFLFNRKQYIQFGKACSATRTLNIGVPQGSILGPLLFLVYVNDLPRLSQNFFPVMFADDCTLQFQDRDIHSLINTCNVELRSLKEWTESNRLTINVGKTNCMFISNMYSSLPDNSINFNNQYLNYVDNTKFLGVTLDSQLKYADHINIICSKISKTIGILFKLRTEVPKSCLKSIYYSLIHPYILYLLPIFAATNEVHIRPLVTLQKRAVRILNGASYYQHTEPLFYDSGILKISDQYKLYLGSYVIKNFNIISEHQRAHHYFTRNRDVPSAPYERLRSTQQSVIFNAINIWNEIPLVIKECAQPSTFKRNFKLHLLNQYNH